MVLPDLKKRCLPILNCYTCNLYSWTYISNSSSCSSDKFRCGFQDNLFFHGTSWAGLVPLKKNTPYFYNNKLRNGCEPARYASRTYRFLFGTTNYILYTDVILNTRFMNTNLYIIIFTRNISSHVTHNICMILFLLCFYETTYQEYIYIKFNSFFREDV